MTLVFRLGFTVSLVFACEEEVDVARLTVEAIGRVCYGVNKVYCESLGDFSIPWTWEDAPTALKNSVLAGAEWNLNHPGRTPEESHAQWMAYKLAEGWQCGPVKDYEQKLHPNLVPYAALPVEQQVKDRLFIAVVDGFRDLAGTIQELRSLLLPHLAATRAFQEVWALRKSEALEDTSK